MSHQTRPERAYSHLQSGPDPLDRLMTLTWLRTIADPKMPLVAGYDPRQLGHGNEDGQGWQWTQGVEHGIVREVLDVICEHGNMVMGEPLLSTGWKEHYKTDGPIAAALDDITKWDASAHEHSVGGDLQGHLLETMRSDGARSGIGAFYTPWPVCYVMALMLEVKPGESVMDPACGSGRMLLAALQVCRERHPGEPDPVLYGTDIDSAAIRACKLNLRLAGYHAPVGELLGRQIAPADTPEGAVIKQRAAESGQLSLEL